jgi:hypothetical protein
MVIMNDKYLTGGGVHHTEIADSEGGCKNFGGCTEIVVGVTEKAVTRYKVVVGAAPRRDGVGCSIYPLIVPGTARLQQ